MEKPAPCTRKYLGIVLIWLQHLLVWSALITCHLLKPRAEILKKICPRTNALQYIFTIPTQETITIFPCVHTAATSQYHHFKWGRKKIDTINDDKINSFSSLTFWYKRAGGISTLNTITAYNHQANDKVNGYFLGVGVPSGGGRGVSVYFYGFVTIVLRTYM